MMNGFVGTVVASLSGGCTQIGTSKTCSSATVHVSPTAGTIFNYTWTNSSGTVVSQLSGSTDTSNTASNLSTGTYYIAVQGQSNCNGSALLDSVVITGGLTAAAVATNGTCIVNGSATANPTGTGPFTYLWSNGATTQTINVAGGTYTVTVTGAGGCQATATTTVASGTNNIALSTSTTNSTCTGNGSATVNISAGTGPFTYAWSNSGTTQTINDIAGTYLVTVTGAGGCTASSSATINQTGNNTSLGTSTTNAGCVSNGTATVTVNTGTGPFTYLWSSGANTQVDSSLAAGTYTVTVTGAGNCTASSSATVSTSGAGLTLSPGVTNATCGNSNGSATVTITSGSAPYTYSWSNGGITVSISGVGAGTYTVTVTGGGGCTATAVAVVSSTNGLTVSAAAVNTTCNSNNGTAIANITTGTGPYTYLWSNGAVTDSVTGVGAGTYMVTVTGQGGCTATAAATVIASNGITLAVSAINTTCGNSNGVAIANITAGTGPFTYFWNTGATTDSVTNLSSGTYTVTVTSANLCTVTDSVVVNPSGGTNVTVTIAPPVICANDSAHVCAPTGFAAYVWNNGKTTQCFYTSNAGNYYVTVTDNGGCTATSNHVSLAVHPQPPVSISVNGDTLSVYNSVTQQWFLNGNMLPGATGSTYIASLSGYYTVGVTDSNGCVTTSNRVELAVGINNIAEDKVQVYPNPSSGSWYLDVSDNLLGSEVDVYDDNGRIVYKSQIRNPKSEIEFNAASGIYLLRLSSSREVVVKKLVKL